MPVTENTLLADQLDKIGHSIAQFHAADKKHVTDTYWYALCTESAAARAFFRVNGSSIINHMAVCSLAAGVYDTFIERGTIAPVVTRAKLEELHCNAQALKDSIPTDVRLPEPVQWSEFHAGLHALSYWMPGPTILSDNKGDIGRRWVIRELAIRFAVAFNRVPVDFVHALVAIVWPDAPLRSVQRELNSETIELIQAQAKSERAATERAMQAKATADQIIQRTNRPLIVLNDAQVDTIDKLQARIDRIKVGMAEFASETLHFRAVLALAGSLPEKAMAAEATQQLGLIGQDFGLT